MHSPLTAATALRLDALFFQLYGIGPDRAAYMNAVAAGDLTTVVKL